MSNSIPREFSPKKAVLSGIAFLASLMMLLALYYSLAVSSYFGPYTGFDYLGFTGAGEDWAVIVIGIFCLLHMIVSLVLIFGNVIAFLLAPRKTSGMVAMVSVILNCVFSFLYMIEGIALASVMTAEHVFTTTFAYLPFLFSIMVAVVFFICRMKLIEDGKESASLTYGYPMTVQPIGSDVETAEDFEGSENGVSPEKANFFLMNFKSYVPEQSLPALRAALERASERQFTTLSMLPLKNPMTVLLFSIFLGGFGVDRFYIGETGMGVAKLLLGGFTFGIWPLVDIFICYKKAKEQNFALLMNALRTSN